MKVCFVQKQMFPYFGVMAVSGQLKKRGHETDIVIDVCEKDAVSALNKTKPDLIAFSALSSEHNWLRKLSAGLKRQMPAVPIAVGGVHSILYPEEILALSGVDYVCCGEGESSFAELVDRIAQKKSAAGIPGIFYKEGGNPVMQDVAPITRELDSFFEDRHLYYEKYPELGKLALKVFMSSRGCPFLCSFCANSYIMEVFKGKGEYIRRKSPQHFVEEIKRVVAEYPTTSLFFADDLFAADIRWLEAFSPLYRKEVSLPYICTARIDLITERLAGLLAGSGCHTVSFGVETGNEQLRREILKKNISNKRIFDGVGIIRKAGIKVQTSNMFCLPGETVDDAVSTIDLNIAGGTDYMFTAVFLPFPKTALAQYCIDKGLLKKDYSFDDMPNSFIQDSVLSLDNKEALLNIHKVAHLCVRFPRAKPFLIYLAKKIKCKQLFLLFWLLGTFIRFKEERKLSLWKTTFYLWEYRRGL
ncbi:MAG: radical SAM protein [Candidatus Omnitrophica bacterium]|nr:radical SAM protein [Candidatus Omnitrophota bacterium]MDD5310190.1 radical SAM protein [Candidatus Omnitrophota bacterium]MDD5546233.1 radical SAM protein [Candidatus Omnitrophota bacterium]